MNHSCHYCHQSLNSGFRNTIYLFIKPFHDSIHRPNGHFHSQKSFGSLDSNQDILSPNLMTEMTRIPHSGKRREFDGELGSGGECRLNPPIVPLGYDGKHDTWSVAVYPIVFASYWCGRHTSRRPSRIVSQAEIFTHKETTS